MNEQTAEVMKKQQNKRRILIWVVLHVMLAIYALSNVCSKFAAKEELLSFRFCLFYGFMILLLCIYAIGWQQIIKRMPLTQAYANKAISVIWACIFGILFFQEKITWGKVFGGLLTFAGVVLFALSEETTNTVNSSNEHKITPDTKPEESEGQ